MATSVLGLKTFAASDPVDYNEVNDNYVKIDNGVKTAMQGRAAYNHIDNSNFQINQRGKTTYTSVSYGVDRWRTNMGGYMTVTVGDGKITLSKSNSAGDFKQILPYDMTGKTVTYALKTSEGITVGTCVVSSTSNLVQIGSLKAYLSVFASNGTTVYRIYFNDSSNVTLDLYWAALYEGTYTADTLPDYVPKGYAAELGECQLYYRRGVQAVTIGKLYTAGSIFSIHFPKMRVDNPTLQLIDIVSQGWGNVDKNNYSAAWGDSTGGENYMNFLSSVTDDIGKTIVVFYESSADL